MQRHTLFVAVFAVILASFSAVLADPLPSPTPYVIVEYPAEQTSVSSTAFNPAITNAGGTTNSAGTFDVVSLARSSSFAGAGSIAVTTSFVVSSASFAPSASVTTPAYLTETGTQSIVQNTNEQSSATKSSVSLIGSASVAAVSSVDAAMPMVALPVGVIASMPFYLFTMAFAVAIGVLAL